MELLAVIAIAVGLSMDAFAISVVTGAAYKELHIRHTLRMAGFFGGFQAFMPAIGYLAGLTVSQYILGYDHWVAFALLVFVGLHISHGFWSGFQTLGVENERRGELRSLGLVVSLVFGVTFGAIPIVVYGINNLLQ